MNRLEHLSPDALQKANDIISSIDLGEVAATKLTSIDDVSKMLGAITTYKDNTDPYHVLTNVFRQRVMLSECYFSNVLATRLESQVRDVVRQKRYKDNSETQDVITRLTRAVHDTLSCPGKETKLHASAYLVDSPSKAIFILKAPRKRLLDEDLIDMVPKKVVETLREWYSLPSEFMTEARAHFVQLLIKNFGGGILLLPLVWDIYFHMPSWTRTDITRPGKKAQFSPDLHSKLAEAMAACTAAVMRLRSSSSILDL